MWRFTLFGIPVGVELWFWVNAALLGGAFYAHGTGEWLAVGIWIGIVFVSIIVHELGHAVAGRQYGATPAIRLHAWGGLTYLPGCSFTRTQNILVSAAGPGAGFLLGIVALIAAFLLRPQEPMLRIALADAIYVNLFWTCMNLLPIQPLDGGHIFRELAGPKHRRWVGPIGAILAAAIAVWAITSGQVFLALFFAFLAYQNFQEHWAGGGIVTD